MSLQVFSVMIRYAHDVVIARQRTREIAALLGFESQEQTRMATAVSEIARNAFNYAGGGKVEFEVEGKTVPQLLVVRISDQGPGIGNLERVLAGQYSSSTGMGLGIVGARRLMDQFHIESSNAGTTVWLKKLFPKRAPLVTGQSLAMVSDQLARQNPQNPLEELRQQNQELLRTLEELRKRKDDLARLNRELEDTNRGVVALYAELDEKADHLRRADEVKSRFLSNMSHEFRTPLNSILALSRLLLDRVDGELTGEQERQVGFIRKAAEGLYELVNDLLDLAKIEAGKIEVRPVEFEVANLFSALRGMLRPVLLSQSVTLVFEEPVDIPPLHTDEGKVSQILRNFVSNALKFTERGEVRVSAEMTPEGKAVVFSVADTGIGIAPEDQQRIFQEFTQLDTPLQRRTKGTGLGLPLSKKLAELLGGTLSVQSQPGIGSTFSAVIPRVYEEPEPATAVAEVAWQPDPARTPVLVVEDGAEDILIYEKFLKGSPFQVIPARTLKEAQEALQQVRPQATILDILLRGEDTWTFLAAMKQDAATTDVPILVVTSVGDQDKGMALGADAYCVKPIERKWLLEQLELLVRAEPAEKILIVDDEEVSRYLFRGFLADTPYIPIEAGNGLEGIFRARKEQPRVIFLDLFMPEMSGFEVLNHLKADPLTRDIPVVISTLKVLEEEERDQLTGKALTVLPKEDLTREQVLTVIGQAVLKLES
jgi:signal transduction histidine kinase/CheY-like chemotaxis protein